ncbi:MAG: MOSC domain-containing protein [Phycicoccus sp.]
MSPEVVAVHASGVHAFSKSTVDGIRLVEGWGVEGDAHAGITVKHRSRVAADPSQPNLRQVHLIHAELFRTLAAAGFEVQPGQLGENVTTRGVDLLGLPVGTRMTLGGATVTVTGLRNPCRQIDAFRPGLLKQLVRTGDDGAVQRLAGVMAVVSRSGSVREGDPVAFVLPPGPHRPLARV